MIDLRKLRKSKGWTQADVENRTGIDASAQSFYENGLRIPTVKHAMKYGELYGFQWSEIFEGIEYDEQRV